MGRPVVATTIAGFVQQLAVQYVGRGYYFFVTGTIPEHKDAEKVDAKLCERYGVWLSKWAKARRRAPVRSQCLCILRAVNRARGEAGLSDVPRTCLRSRRRVVRPFEPDPTG